MLITEVCGLIRSTGTCWKSTRMAIFLSVFMASSSSSRKYCRYHQHYYISGGLHFLSAFSLPEYWFFVAQCERVGLLGDWVKSGVGKVRPARPWASLIRPAVARHSSLLRLNPACVLPPSATRDERLFSHQAGFSCTLLKKWRFLILVYPQQAWQMKDLKRKPLRLWGPKIM